VTRLSVEAHGTSLNPAMVQSLALFSAVLVRIQGLGNGLYTECITMLSHRIEAWRYAALPFQH